MSGWFATRKLEIRRLHRGSADQTGVTLALMAIGYLHLFCGETQGG